MTPEQLKFYTELMKSLTAFILGTGAGIFALITSEEVNVYFLTFVVTLCILSMAIFLTLLVYIEKNMKP